MRWSLSTRSGVLAPALALALAVCAGLSGPLPGHAAPPAGADPNGAAAAWFNSLLNAEGKGCCSSADCRRTALRPTPDGDLEAWIGKEQFGPHAPDQWMRVPPEEIKTRGNRPPGIHGAIICYYQQRVFCADLEAGI